VNVGSLFSGIGGFELGFERCGMSTLWQVEQDAYCRAVLARHFPEARRFEDVRDVGAQDLAPVDLICGGFPCQDLSSAGHGAGIDAARSGLWSEFARIIRELRPGYVVVENVPALLTGKGKRWDRAPVGRVLGDLAEAGYDAEWACLSAREFGAPHLRKRVWIVAYPARDAQAGAAAATGSERKRAGQGGAASRARAVSDADRDGRSQGLLLGSGPGERSRPADALGRGAVEALADAEGVPERPRLRQGGSSEKRRGRSRDRSGARGVVANAERVGRQRRSDQPRRGDPQRPSAVGSKGPAHPARGRQEEGSCGRLPASEGWGAEPDVGRVADGVPNRVDRLAALGNALVPQIAEWIGQRILAYEEEAASGETQASEVSAPEGQG
jgi:DNA (cytosine-5)-methyltransferase 1